MAHFSRHFGIFHEPKHVTTGSKWPKNTCLSIASGLGTTLEKIFFLPWRPWWTHRWPLCVGWPALRLHQVTTGTGVYVSRWAILRLGNHKRWGVAGPWTEFVFEPRSPRYGPLLVPGCWCTLRRQASTQATTTTRLRAVLAIAPSQRLEPDSTLAILQPRWWPCQIQVLSQKLTGGGPGRWRQVGRCPPKSAQFWTKNSHFSPKTALVRVQNSQTKANGCYTARAA